PRNRALHAAGAGAGRGGDAAAHRAGATSMSDTSAPIQLAPKRSHAPHVLNGIRAAGRWVHLALALAIVLGVFVQVYLIGSYFFGAGQGALDAHAAGGGA